MSADLFAAAIAVVLAEEGPYALEPGDPGGETKWGIARNAHPEISAAAWANFTRNQALAIYRAQYWDAHWCGMMPWRWALAIFDGEVNQGSVIALAQRALGAKPDGKVGGDTLGALSRATDEHFAAFMAARARAYIALSRFPTDGAGWLKRLFNVTLHAAITPVPH
jgi:lysozyme family protein